MRRMIHRNGPNRPHISSVTSDFKERRDKSDRVRPNFSARPASSISVFFLASRCRKARLAPRRCISAPPVRGYLRPGVGVRKGFFAERCVFFSTPSPLNKIWGLATDQALDEGRARKKNARVFCKKRFACEKLTRVRLFGGATRAVEGP